MNDIELNKALAEYAKTAGMDPKGKSAFAETIIQLIEPEHLSLDLFNTFMPTRQAQLGDTTIRRVRRGRYGVQTMVPGTNHLVSQPMDVQDFHTYVFDRLIGGVRESVWNLRQGDLTSIEGMRRQLQFDLTDNLVQKVFSLLTSVWNSTDTPDHYVQTAELTYPVLDTLIENVLYTAGNVRAIIGTRRALLPIYKFAGWREYAYMDGTTNPIAYPINDKLMEYLNTRRVSMYMGIPIIELPQIFANQLPSLRQALIPEDKILVVGANAGEILMYGGVEYQDYTDMTIQPADYVLNAWMSYGMVVDMPENLGVIKLT
jgi:hypothetical protein